MNKTTLTGPTAPNDAARKKRDDTQPFVKGSVKGSLKTMHKKSGTADNKHAPIDVPDNPFEGDGYRMRRLPDDHARRVLEGREGVVASQANTDEFLAFLMSRPTPEDADPR